MKSIFTTKLPEKEDFQTYYRYEKDGYVVELWLEELAEKFETCKYQKEDPLGKIAIKGNDIDFLLKRYVNSYGEKYKVPLRDGRDVVVYLGKRIMEKHRKHVDYGLLHSLFQPLFQKFYDDFFTYGEKY